MTTLDEQREQLEQLRAQREAWYRDHPVPVSAADWRKMASELQALHDGEDEYLAGVREWIAAGEPLDDGAGE